MHIQAAGTEQFETATPNRLTSRWVFIIWSYLALIGVAELVTSLASLMLGLALHIGLFIGLLLHGSLAPQAQQRAMILSLALAPLIRILSLTLPLDHFPRLAWYPLVGAPVIGAAWMLMRQLELRGAEVGLRLGSVPAQLLLGAGGVCLGAVEYEILRPELLAPVDTWQQFGLAALILFVGTGFMEELVFRGLLQTVALRALGKAGLPCIAMLFAVLHIGYLSFTDVLFVGAVGLIFGYSVMRSGSLLGVAVAHGLTNITLFLVLPALNMHAVAPGWVAGVAWASAAAGLCGLALVAHAAPPPAPPTYRGADRSEFGA